MSGDNYLSRDFKLVEKKNHLAVHALFWNRESAESYLRDTVPLYVKKRYYSDKSLTAESFEILAPGQA